MSDFLAEMANDSSARAAAIRRRFRDADFDLPVVPMNLDRFDVIAEIKERSPSAGALGGPGGRADRARQYVRGGAAAISVLTEPSRFAGSLAHLEEVVRAVSGSGVPVMRKDFLVDGKQILEARAAGASGILLIAAMLSDGALPGLLDCAREHALFVLLEAFDEEDLGRIGALLEDPKRAGDAAAGKLLVGVNVRNLRTLAVDEARLAQLAPALPPHAVTVAESGLGTPEDAAAAAGLGYRAGLVGTALMRSADPAALIGNMLRAGRAAAAA